MEWFKHDTSASADAKIKKLLLRHGALGYAVYFHCLELIAGDISKSNLTFELEHDSEIIADNLKIQGDANKSGIEIVEEIMRYIVDLKLFQCSGGRIFCFQLLNRLDLSMTSNKKFREMIVQAKKHHDTVMTPSCKNRIDKNRIEENIARPKLDEVIEYVKEKNYNVDPEHFFHHYEANGWTQSNGKKIKKWQSAVVTWVKNSERFEKKQEGNKDLKKYIDEVFDE